jgi:hypothetical protein
VKGDDDLFSGRRDGRWSGRWSGKTKRRYDVGGLGSVGTAFGNDYKHLPRNDAHLLAAPVSNRCRRHPPTTLLDLRTVEGLFPGALERRVLPPYHLSRPASAGCLPAPMSSIAQCSC